MPEQLKTLPSKLGMITFISSPESIGNVEAHFICKQFSKLIAA